MRSLPALLLGLGFTLLLLTLLSAQPASGTTVELEIDKDAIRSNLSTHSSSSRMVVVPSGDAEPIALAAEDLAFQLEDETNRDVHAFIYSCYGAAIDAMVDGSADIGWLPPIAYVLAHDRFGIDAKLITVRDGITTFRGEFIVQSGTGINNLSDLAGKNFAFVDPLSASGYLYPALHISKTQGITHAAFFSQTVFAGSHSDVVRAVYNGQHQGTAIQGGSTFEGARWTVINEFPDVFSKTKVISYTDLIPNDTVSIRPGLDPLLTQQLITGLLTIASNQEGQETLQQLYGIDGLQPTTNSTYDIARQLAAAFGLEYETCTVGTNVDSGSGGSVTFIDPNDLTTTLEIPPGAVTAPTRINFSPLPVITYRPECLSEIGHSFEARAAISGTNQILTSLQTPYTIAVTYADSELGTVSEDSLVLYYWDGSQWLIEPSSEIDVVNNVVAATSDQISSWAVLGNTQCVYLPLVLK